MNKEGKCRFFSIILALSISFSGFFMLGIDANAASATVKFEKSSYILNKGDAKKLTLKNATGKITWGSTNSKIAKVDSKGKVTALKAGTAKIVATTNYRSYICTIKVMNAASFTYNKHKYTAIDRGLTWTQAKKYCESIGGHLITINSEGEQKALVNFLKTHPGINRNNYWLGAKKNSEQKMQWVTGEKFSYTAWAPGQPDFSQEDCLMIYRYNNPNTNGDDAYLWNDLVNAGTFGSESWFGLNNFGFICEWDN